MKNKIKKTIIVALLASLPSITFASTSCYTEAENFDEGSAIGGFDKEQAISDAYDALQDPSQDLYACYIQSATESPKAVIEDHCGCLEAVEESCKFEFDKGSLSITASGGASATWCSAFSFMAYL
ncbi:hypothetical protein [Psychromonas sp. SP041]|uniref:hypothetical protein n=1 Tax=Psychromonas sp. SP041 TaxID=1365007 RepID=UPI0010C77F75|nr:hypothetical protein [Psychromonas sp. SP041]